MATFTPPRTRSAGQHWLDAQQLKPIQIAALLGCTTPTVSHWMRGYNQAPHKFYAAIEILRGREARDELEAILEPLHRTKKVLRRR